MRQTQVGVRLERQRLRMLVRAAKLYYERGLTHQAIADEMGVSRVKVTRLIGEARKVGIVRISVHDPTREYPDVEERLASQLGIARVRVAALNADRSVRAAVAADAASLLAEEVKGTSFVAFGVSTLVADTVARLESIPVPGAQMLPLSGGWAGVERRLNPDLSATVAARAFTARAHALATPLVAPSGDLASSLGASEGVSRVLSIAAKSDIAIVGLGSSPGERSWKAAPLASAVSPTEVAQLVSGGAVGDVSGRFFDAKGDAVKGDFDRRVIGLDLDQFRRIPERVAVVSGIERVPAIRGAAAGGVISTLVTDRLTASELLQADPRTS